MSQPSRRRKCEVRERRLRARQDHQRRVARQRPSGLHHDQLDPGLGAQRVEIVEIGDARQYRHGDAGDAYGWLRRSPPHPSLSPRRGRGSVMEAWSASESSAGSNEAAGKNGTVPNERSPVRSPIAAMPPSNEPDIAAEFVDDVAGEQRPFAVATTGPGADESGR